MRARSIACIVAAALAVVLPAARSGATLTAQGTAREGRGGVNGASLYTREIGRGQPLVVLHGAGRVPQGCRRWSSMIGSADSG